MSVATGLDKIKDLVSRGVANFICGKKDPQDEGFPGRVIGNLF